MNASDDVNNAAPVTLTINITNVGDIWLQKGADLDGEVASDKIGYAVSLSSDGTVVAIGAEEAIAGNGSDSGHTRIYQWQ